MKNITILATGFILSGVVNLSYALPTSIDVKQVDQLFNDRDSNQQFISYMTHKNRDGVFNQVINLREKSLDKGNAIGIKVIKKKKSVQNVVQYEVEEYIVNCSKRTMLMTTGTYKTNGDLLLKSNQINKRVEGEIKDTVSQACIKRK
jgi:hypothetical protein